MYQVRWHGRGGQGAVTAAKIFAMAASLQAVSEAALFLKMSDCARRTDPPPAGTQLYFAQSFPAFGAERRGAPVQAFTKIDSSPILDRSQVYEPDAVVVLDPGLLQSIDVTAGLKPGGLLVINGARLAIGRMPLVKFDCTIVNATEISLEILGKPIANTVMVGALCAVLNFMTLASIQKAIAGTLPAHLAAANIKAAEVAYYEVISGKKGAQIA